MHLDQTSEKNILNMLMDSSVISTEQMKKIRSMSKEIGKSELQTAFELNLTNEEKIRDLLAKSYSLETVQLEKYRVTNELRKIFDLRFLENNCIVPFETNNDYIKVAIPDGSKLSLMKTMQTSSSKMIEIYAAKISDIDTFYNKLSNKNTDKNNSNQKLQQVKKEKKNVPIEVESDVIAFGDKIIGEAIDMGASDIHIEAFRNTSKVRFRTDGVLKTMDEYTKFLHNNYNAVITRVKIISKLDIAERRVPQDGASTFKKGDKEVDLRVSILPTKNNERIVMRILNKDAGDKALADLGFEENDLKKLIKAITAPQGMVLVTGPTGSGKTTTLYSILKHINKPDMNILTAEDPVEYEMEGIGQVHVREDIGYTFASALRAFLRQDPEVILVGEIRDKDTVDISLKAALTGHLVFSTIHTNDAPSTITRLQNMGTPNYLISAALTLVMAQRLGRKTCLECKIVDDSVTPQVLTSIGFSPEQANRAKVYKGKGCDNCNQTGYKGRMGIYEILEVNKHLKQGILSNLGQAELVSIAKKNGFKTMQSMGHDLLLSGDLTYKEYDRILSSGSN